MEVAADFLDHWKTQHFCELLEDPLAPLYVLRIWAHCELRRQWRFDNLSPAALKTLCRYPGHANKLEASLVTSGFVRRDGSLLVVANWDVHNAALIAEWQRVGKVIVEPVATAVAAEQPTGKKKRQPKPKKEDYTPEFEEFWNTYPALRRTKKIYCFERWEAAVARLTKRFTSAEAAIAFLQARCEEFAASPLGRCEYCNAPEVWLNGGGYDAPKEAWQRDTGVPTKASLPRIRLNGGGE